MYIKMCNFCKQILIKKTFDLLQANKEYMQAEVIAWVEENKNTGFTYNKTKCQRDLGIIVDDICMDLLLVVQVNQHLPVFNIGTTE